MFSLICRVGYLIGSKLHESHGRYKAEERKEMTQRKKRKKIRFKLKRGEETVKKDEERRKKMSFKEN
jgi:hypothetical protein